MAVAEAVLVSPPPRQEIYLAALPAHYPTFALLLRIPKIPNLPLKTYRIARRETVHDSHRGALEVDLRFLFRWSIPLLLCTWLRALAPAFYTLLRKR